MTAPLEGRSALVTGAARGIGARIATALAQSGARVYGFDVQDPEAEWIPERLLRGDVRSVDDVRGAVQHVVRSAGTLHILVNNAAVGVTGPFLEAEVDSIDNMLDTNIRGPLLFAQEAARAMVRDRVAGRIINIGSLSADRGVAGSVVYAASKGGLHAFTRSLAIELSPHGILCNCVVPGPTDTGMLRILSEQERHRRLSRVPLGRLADPQEIASLVVFLASDQAAFITGQVIAVDGGISAFGI